jgi:hypothetical protein
LRSARVPVPRLNSVPAVGIDMNDHDPSLARCKEVILVEPDAACLIGRRSALQSDPENATQSRH